MTVSDTASPVLYELRDGGVAVVTLNRPEVLNALNTQMGRDLLDLWTRLTEDPEDVRCVVLTGAGERAAGKLADAEPAGVHPRPDRGRGPREARSADRPRTRDRAVDRDPLPPDEK